MKIIKGLAILFFFTAILLGSCFEPPEFPVTPQIEYEDVVYVEAKQDTALDSLTVYIKFKDGDGDLGLNPEDLAHISYPYHSTTYFQENSGQLDSIVTSHISINGYQFDLLDISNPGKGDLVFPRTKNKPSYGFLPDYGTSCSYEFLTRDRKLYIHQEDTAVLDRKKFLDTIKVSPTVAYYQIQDTLYSRPNPNYHNIEVEFFEKTGANTFTKFDWSKYGCQTTYNQRFPVLSETTTALDGTIKYHMTSLGFKEFFGSKYIKLRIQIKDRALHKSNMVETPEFTLDQKKRRGP